MGNKTKTIISSRTTNSYLEELISLSPSPKARMKSPVTLISMLLALLCAFSSSTSAFVVRPSAIAPAAASTTSMSTTSTSLNVFGTRKSKAQKEAEAQKAAMYWEGEWVCKDCGYIYNRVRTSN